MRTKPTADQMQALFDDAVDNAVRIGAGQVHVQLFSMPFQEALEDDRYGASAGYVLEACYRGAKGLDPLRHCFYCDKPFLLAGDGSRTAFRSHANAPCVFVAADIGSGKGALASAICFACCDTYSMADMLDTVARRDLKVTGPTRIMPTDGTGTA